MPRWLGQDAEGNFLYETPDGSIIPVPGSMMPGGPPTDLGGLWAAPPQVGLPGAAEAPGAFVSPYEAWEAQQRAWLEKFKPLTPRYTPKGRTFQPPGGETPPPAVTPPPGPADAVTGGALPLVSPQPPTTAPPAIVAEQPPEVQDDSFEATARREADVRAKQAQAGVDVIAEGVAEGQKRLTEMQSFAERSRAETADRAMRLEKEIDTFRTQGIPLSTGQQIAGLVGASIAGFLNPTGPNSMVSVMQNVIANETQRHLSALEMQRAGVREGRFAAMDQLKDMATMAAAHWDTVVQEAEAAKMQHAAPAIRAQADLVIAAARERGAAEREKAAMAENARQDQLRMQAAAIAQRDIASKRAAAAAAAGRQLERERLELQKRAEDRRAMALGDLSILHPGTGAPVGTMTRGSTKERQEFTKMYTAASIYVHDLRELREQMKKVGRLAPTQAGEYLRSEEGKALEAMFVQTFAQTWHDLWGATMTGGETAIRKKGFPDLQTWLTSSPDEAYRMTIEKTGQHMQVRGNTLVGAQEIDADGNPTGQPVDFRSILESYELPEPGSGDDFGAIYEE